MPEATQQVSNRTRIQILAVGCGAWATLTPQLKAWPGSQAPHQTLRISCSRCTTAPGGKGYYYQLMLISLSLGFPTYKMRVAKQLLSRRAAVMGKSGVPWAPNKHLTNTLIIIIIMIRSQFTCPPRHPTCRAHTGGSTTAWHSRPRLTFTKPSQSLPWLIGQSLVSKAGLLLPFYS